MMKLTVERLLKEALCALQETGVVLASVNCPIKVERCKDAEHGDFATNIALALAKPCGISPRKMAEALVDALAPDDMVLRVEIAGPGFINFFMKADVLLQIIPKILAAGDEFGRSTFGQGQRVLLEYVSANPTGPLHVGHGRGAAFGATLANILSMAGFSVTREYYVNDAGRQMDILAVSVWLRYLSACGENIVFPVNGYRGDYVNNIATLLMADYARKFVCSWPDICASLPKDETDGGDKEIYIDALILAAKRCIGQDGFALFHKKALDVVLQDIKEDLAEFGVEFDDWFSERMLLEDGSIAKGIVALKEGGHTYEKGGALWFRATDYGDEKDRVLLRANGQPTYFASDVAYHWNKYNRGFTKVIDVFGADHHGYVSRIKSAVAALGHDDSALTIILVQFAILYREGQRVQMSTRSGSFVTLRELREEVGNDAARFFYVMRKTEQHMDFDLDLAKSESNDNPVYYIQYAHARISSVLRQMAARGLHWDAKESLPHVDLLIEPQETALLVLLSRYTEVITTTACSAEPHLLAYYLRDLATGLHSYYNAVPVLCEQDKERGARICLLTAVRQVLRNGMKLLGVSAPESM